MGIHMNAVQTGEDLKEGELSLSLLKKYIGFCRRYEATFFTLLFDGWIVILIFFRCSRCGPRLSEASAEKLKNRYVLMRSGVREHEMDTEKRLNIPITVR